MSIVQARLAFLALLAVVANAECRLLHAQVPGTQPTAEAHVTEAIWLAVLRSYASYSTRSEGDVTLSTNRLMGTGEQSSRAPIVLWVPAAKTQQYRRAWLDSLVHERLVRSICTAADLDGCADSVMTSFLDLVRPEMVADSSATVTVTDHGRNPAACRAKAGAVMGGFMSMRFEVVRDKGAWAVRKKDMEMAGTTICGFTAEEEARMARLAREDSLLREEVSIIAGTYRVTVTFESGDSSVLFFRTELHPMSALRDRGRDDLLDRGEHKINGYYIATCAAGSVDSIPNTFSFPCLQSYFALSLRPIATTPDSVTWHGDLDPLAEVSLRDPSLTIRAKAESLFGVSERGRDNEWYFMPGVWITYKDGRVRHLWTVKDGTHIAYRVRADRISTETLVSRSR